MPDDQSTVYVEDETLRTGYTIIPNAIARRPDISPGAKLAYVILLSYAWQTGACFPGQERMAADMGVHKRSLIRYLQELQAVGLLVITRRGLGQTNLYRLPRWQSAGSDKSPLQEVTESAAPEVTNRHTKKTQKKSSYHSDKKENTAGLTPDYLLTLNAAQRIAHEVQGYIPPEDT